MLFIWFITRGFLAILRKQSLCAESQTKQEVESRKKCPEIMWQTDEMMKGEKKREIVGHFCITVN